MSTIVGKCANCNTDLIFNNGIENGFYVQSCTNCNTKYKLLFENYNVINYERITTIDPIKVTPIGKTK